MTTSERPVKRIGFLSFGHWSDGYGSEVRTAADALLQSIELAVAAEELGADGAYFRVHHFARQLGSPLPLLPPPPASSARPPPSSPPSARAPAGSRSARPSSTCATRTRSTWSRMRGRPT